MRTITRAGFLKAVFLGSGMAESVRTELSAGAVDMSVKLAKSISMIDVGRGSPGLLVRMPKVNPQNGGEAFHEIVVPLTNVASLQYTEVADAKEKP